MAVKHETKAARRERANQILSILEQTYPDSRIALDFESPFELIVAVILAAQCTDVRVNMVTPGLFDRYPTPKTFIDVPQEVLEREIFTCGFYRNKAKAIKAASQTIVEQFGGNVPGTMEELLSIPGIGRKSANVLLGHCFGTPGVVVDTHVKRIANLLGLVNVDDPEKIERALMELFPEDKWTRSGHLIQSFGRAICIARRPLCEVCPLSHICPSAFVAIPARAALKSAHTLARPSAASVNAQGKNAGAKRKTAKKAGAQNAGAQNARAKGVGTKSAGAKNTGAKSAGAKGAGTKNAGAKSAGAKSAGAKSAGAKSAGAKSAGAKSAGAKSAGAKSTVTKNAGAKSAVTKNAGATNVPGKITSASIDGAKRTADNSANAKNAGAKTRTRK